MFYPFTYTHRSYCLILCFIVLFVFQLVNEFNNCLRFSAAQLVDQCTRAIVPCSDFVVAGFNGIERKGQWVSDKPDISKNTTKGVQGIKQKIIADKLRISRRTEKYYAM